MRGERSRNAPGDRVVVGDPHDQPALALHQPRHVVTLAPLYAPPGRPRRASLHRVNAKVHFVRSYASSRLNTTDALVPPKPNEFDSTQPSFTLSRRSRTIGMSAKAGSRFSILALSQMKPVHHQERVDRLLRAGGAERMAGQRLGRRDRRTLVAEHLADRLDLLEVADRRRGRVRIDVVDRRLHVLERHAHAAHRALARRRDHVVAVRGRAVAGDFGVDARAARLGVLVVPPAPARRRRQR